MSERGPWIPNPLKIPRSTSDCCPPAGLLSLKLSLTPASSSFPPSVERGCLFLHHSITNREPDRYRSPTASPQSTWLALERTVTPFPLATEPTASPLLFR